MSVFTVTRRVEFSDTDMAGIMHFANYFRFMESAEHAFFRSLGMSIMGGEADGIKIGWPRVHAECDYLAPLYFEDEVQIELSLKAVNRRTIEYGFVLRRIGDDVEAARGGITIVCVSWDPSSGKMKSVSIPDSIRALLEAGPKGDTELPNHSITQ
jgi:YbgC/YbaW family acyl-CoA thioester hydrolase